MKTNKYFISIAITIVCLILSGCKGTDSHTVAISSNAADIDWVSYENPLVFDSLEEFTDYIQDDSIVLAPEVDEANKINERAFRTFTEEKEKSNAVLPVINMSVFEETMNAELIGISINNSNVAFDITTPIDSEKMLDTFGSDNTEEIAEEINQVSLIHFGKSVIS